MRICIELDDDAQPIAGWVERVGKPRREFRGMLELMTLLQELRQRDANLRPGGNRADLSGSRMKHGLEQSEGSTTSSSQPC